MARGLVLFGKYVVYEGLISIGNSLCCLNVKYSTPAWLFVVECEDGGDGGEAEAGDEQRVPDLGLVVALHGKCFAEGRLKKEIP